MKILSHLIIHFISSFLTAFGFSILYSIPKKAIISASFTGAIGWTSYFFLTNYLSFLDFIATIIASFFIAFASQIFARLLKTPVIIFTLPGLIPLVPGGMAYNMMRAFFEGNSDLAFHFATNTFLTAGALALGLSINGIFFHLISSKDIFKPGKKYIP